MNVKLTRLPRSKSGSFRCARMGSTGLRAVKGLRFYMLAESLDKKGGLRYLETADVISIEEDKPECQVFQTQNSRYKAEFS